MKEHHKIVITAILFFIVLGLLTTVGCTTGPKVISQKFYRSDAWYGANDLSVGICRFYTCAGSFEDSCNKFFVGDTLPLRKH